MGLKLITPPTELPVSLAQVKQQLSVTHSADDELISMMLNAAVQMYDGANGWLGRCLMPQRWELSLDDWPDAWLEENVIELPLPPLIAVESITYSDTGGDDVVIPAEDYVVDASGIRARIEPVSSWPSSSTLIGSIRVLYRAGYAGGESPADSPEPETVPAPLRQAIMMTVRDLYDQRSSFVVGTIAGPIPNAIEHLINGYRIFRV